MFISVDFLMGLVGRQSHWTSANPEKMRKATLRMEFKTLCENLKKKKKRERMPSFFLFFATSV